MRILFMGTPDIAAECLKALYAAGHDICAVYTRRDKPVGRKQVLTAPPVKEVALEHGTPVFQPRTLRDGRRGRQHSARWPRSSIVVVAYGCILPASPCWNMPRNTAASICTSPCCPSTVAAPRCSGQSSMGIQRRVSPSCRWTKGLDTGDVLYCEKIAR